LNSRLGLIDNQVTINYDLSMPTLEGMGEKKPSSKRKKMKKKDKFAILNNFNELP